MDKDEWNDQKPMVERLKCNKDSISLSKYHCRHGAVAQNSSIHNHTRAFKEN